MTTTAVNMFFLPFLTVSYYIENIQILNSLQSFLYNQKHVCKTHMNIYHSMNLLFLSIMRVMYLNVNLILSVVVKSDIITEDIYFILYCVMASLCVYVLI